MTNKIENLEKELLRHKALYYKGEPEISDTEYDKLELDLKKLNPESYVLNVVGSQVESSKKVKHKKKMLSLNKTYELKSLIEWKKEYDLISIFKIDGVSCSLIYQEGKLVMAKTRGDGVTGEDITEKIMWIPSIPKRISHKEEVEIRGEIFCYEEKFFALADDMEKLGLPKPTSQRNIVAGLVGRKDRVELSRYLDFFAFDVLGADSKKELEKFKWLEKNKFVTPPYEHHRSDKSIEKSLDQAMKFMSEGDYLIDGLVFTYNEISVHRELGETAHHPRYKMAFKYQGIAKETKIEEISWSVSRNGILTPVANVEEVELSGAKISRVTLHNYGMVRQYNLKKGDVIEIIRSGEVIPKFLKVIKPSKNKYDIPSKCPCCATKLEEADIRLICPNEKCPAVVKESILNFIQKIGIDDLSSKRLDEMINKKLVTSISDLYRLEKQDFFKLDKVKDKLADKLYANIRSSMDVDLVVFLSSLGISGGAYNKCEKVVFAGYNNLNKVMTLNSEKLQEIDSFAEKSADEFFTSLQTKFELIKELKSLGFKIKKIEDKKDSALGGKKICMTGTLSVGRNEMEGLLRDHGAQVVSSVSKNTDYLLTNDKESGSSKTKKAKTLGIQIINEKELHALL